PRLDSGALVRRAVRLLADPTTPPPFRAVVVDDAQDLTAAGVDLVVALGAAGARVMVCSCPDVAVETFRGALPDAADRLREALPRPVGAVVLRGADERATGLTAAGGALGSRVPRAGAPPPRAPAPPPPRPARVPPSPDACWRSPPRPRWTRPRRPAPPCATSIIVSRASTTRWRWCAAPAPRSRTSPICWRAPACPYVSRTAPSRCGRSPRSPIC